MAATLAARMAANGLIGRIGTVANVMARAMRRMAAIVRDRRAFARLADRDDRLLADIGLERGDVLAARAAPPWRDPTKILAGRRQQSSTTISHQELDR